MMNNYYDNDDKKKILSSLPLPHTLIPIPTARINSDKSTTQLLHIQLYSCVHFFIYIALM